MKTLNLTVTKQWFYMILSGEKTEEYRELKEYWQNRLMHYEIAERNSFALIKRHTDYKAYTHIQFRNGYAKNAPTMIVECNGITIGKCRPEWSGNMEGDHFIIHLGKILETKNIQK